MSEPRGTGTESVGPGSELHRGRPRIGVFDSGFGGLTVLDALTRSLPGADFLYLGDTARLPYGSKSAETVTRYTAAAIRVLAAHGAELVVIACNTASALALPTLEESSATPLVGVIAPGARAAAEVLRGKGAESHATVLVLATEATVASHAYAAACASEGFPTFEKACPLLVPMVEEGWTEHPVTAQIAQIYLGEAMDQMRDEAEANGTASPGPAAILLGCTHYPLLRKLLERTAADVTGEGGSPVPIVDSAAATAEYVRTLLPDAVAGDGRPPRIRFFATDSPTKFQRIGERFLRHPIPSVELVDLDA